MYNCYRNPKQSRSRTMSAVAPADRYVQPAPQFHHSQRNQSEYAKYRDVRVEFTRVLTDESVGRMEYAKYNKKINSLMHWGQRKLLMSELEFLTLCLKDERCRECKVVVYAGSASGEHIVFLADTFSDIKFVLVDPGRFSSKIVEYAAKSNGRVVIHQDFFSEETAKLFPGEMKPGEFLFISDIRNTDVTDNEQENDRVVQADMQMQMQWVECIKPLRSMLKFRMPFPKFDKVTKECLNQDFHYLSGDIYLPVWGPPGTAECRLITNTLGSVDDEPEKKTYDCLAYEQQMRYFNVVTRPHIYGEGTHCMDCGLDQCYDCYAEERILTECRKATSAATLVVHKRVSDASNAISRSINESVRSIRDFTRFHAGTLY